ncbi:MULTISPECIES: tyrosine-type recombinase/integrase [unclassified Paenibacillus]|uniref:tyrosine-type recombinase/integrase n=1 Tax=unclassified Paenibacillus TaxID=185978 RepID=UPI0015C5AD2D|nr:MULTISPECIES: tyrosine-type recombinase/integrase [unclassified Paenibacillus]MBY3621305.1 tyrosine-type recombinase/integrase [Acinetobacter sp. CUI P1]MDH6373100.1 integrase [Paenibacillus sp. PastF-3]
MKKNKILASMNRYGHNKDEANMEIYREEIAKDRWDVRNLGIPFNTTRAEYFLTFEKIDITFRELIKKYIQHRLFVQDSIKFSTARSEVMTLVPFIKFIVLKNPHWVDLKSLTRNDICEYFESLKNSPMKGNKSSNYRVKKPTDYFIWRMIGGLENFLYYLQRYEWVEAPGVPIRKLIYQEDRPKLKPKNDEDYKHVSDYVWEQILANLDLLDDQYATILLLMEASGFRLIDILNSNQDCLIEINDQYWVRSGRKNSRYEFPMVPIQKDLAELMKTYRNKVKELLGKDHPNKLLFIRYKGNKGVGKQILQLSFLRSLDRFAERANITDESGNVFHFTANGFKHRFGLKLMKAGLNMAQVHQMISNVTSEMPMIYARKIQKEMQS